MKCATMLTLLASILIGSTASARDLLPFVQRLIVEYERASQHSAPVEIWEYEYRGERVFYLPLARVFCCDILSELYDAGGDLICRPDGGFTGRGDGRCPDFFERRSSGTLVWRGADPDPERAVGDAAP